MVVPLGYLISDEWRTKANGKLGHMDALQACCSKMAALVNRYDGCQYSKGFGY